MLSLHKFILFKSKGHTTRATTYFLDILLGGKKKDEALDFHPFEYYYLSSTSTCTVQ